MLNIRRLSPGAADYYRGEVATAAEDYNNTGHGEAAGRWVGSLLSTSSIGLSGAVRPEQFRAVLDGRHPFTGQRLVSRGSSQSQLFDRNQFDVTRAASRLRLTRANPPAPLGRPTAPSVPAPQL